MSLKTAILKWFVVNKIMKSLTGNIRDLKKITKYKGLPIKNPGLKAFLTRLNEDVEEEKGLGLLFARLGKAANPVTKRKFIENGIWNWTVEGNRRRRDFQTEDLWFPCLVAMSPSMRCNLKCTGCYSGLYTKEGELSEEEVDRVLTEMRSLGAYFAVLTGGEPFILKEMLLRMFKKHDDMYFLTYTNGTLLDEPTVKELARVGNVMPAISLEGYKEHTDKRRGSGVYDRILEAMARLKREGVIFGVSVTYTRENVDTVTKDEFVEFFLDKGAMFAWYFMFMPVGKDPILELVPTPEQRLYCGKRVAELRKKYPIFMADFWNDGPAAAGCLAAGRQYLHIVNSGRVEACVFAHFGVDNIRDKTLLEAANSPFFKAIRSKFPYNDNANLRRPCMIIDNPAVLRELVGTYMAEGHVHSEDIVQDPKVVEWVDRYAEEFRELVDPIWEREINDPANRWYKEGQEYKRLFRFRAKAPVGPASGASARGDTTKPTAKPADESARRAAAPGGNGRGKKKTGERMSV
jgi:MoaA/NifB/PqqE/SkfB family radical SAM enzyme